MSKGRVESFSDGVFAVAITILVFNVQLPHGVAPGQLLRALAAQWPTYAAYVASFMTVGIMWINHHAMFQRLAHVDRPLLILNLCLLMTIVLVPFPTQLMGQYVPSGGADARAAATVYAGLALLISICFTAIWLYSLSHPTVLVPGMDRQLALRMAPRFSVGFVMYLLCLPLAQFSPIAVAFVLALVAAYYAYERLPEPVRPGAGEGQPEPR